MNWRRYIAWGALAYAVLLAVSYPIGRRLQAYIPPCPRPCADLGSEIEPIAHDYGGKVYLAKCSPIQLGLELDKPETQVNKRYTLFYRVTATNVSCASLKMYLPHFTDSNYLNPGYNWIAMRIWDPAGHELEAGSPGVSSTMFGAHRTEYGDVIPYSEDLAAYVKLKKDLGIAKPGELFFDLKPGQSVSTTPSQVNPRTMEIRDVDERSGPSTVIAHVPAKIKGKPIPIPPPGFRILDQFVFKTPGTYRVQVSQDDKIDVELPEHPYQGAANLIGIPWLPIFIPAWPVISRHPWLWWPDYPRKRRYQFHSESKVLEFSVKAQQTNASSCPINMCLDKHLPTQPGDNPMVRPYLLSDMLGVSPLYAIQPRGNT